MNKRVRINGILYLFLEWCLIFFVNVFENKKLEYGFFFDQFFRGEKKKKRFNIFSKVEKIK